MVIADPTRETNRPYPPPSNLVSVLHRLRSRNLPERIDAEYLRDAGIPDGTVSRTLFALRFLRLITDANEPSQALRSIGVSTDEEYLGTLAGLVREAYQEVFNVLDPAEDSQDRILNVFRRYTPASQRQRMVIFFLGMCREAGIPTLDVPRARGMTDSRQPSRGIRQAPHPVASSGQARNTRQQSRTQQPPSLMSPQSSLPPALDGLVRSLPPAGSPFSVARRQQWLRMAEATFGFIYTDEDTPNEEVDEEDDGHK